MTGGEGWVVCGVVCGVWWCCQLEEGHLRLGPDARCLHRRAQLAELRDAVLGRGQARGLPAGRLHRRAEHVLGRVHQAPLLALGGGGASEEVVEDVVGEFGGGRPRDAHLGLGLGLGFGFGLRLRLGLGFGFGFGLGLGLEP